MALELKGLKANVSGLRSDIEALNNLAAGGREKAAVLKSHLGDIQTEIGQHVDDIEFTANVLGNSGGSSAPSAEPVQPPLPPTRPIEPMRPAPPPAPVSGAVGAAPSVTFPTA